MMEVNCETDFVAKNNQFLHFASKAVQAISDHVMPHPSPPPGGINHFESHDLMSMEPTDVGHGTLGDLMAENIGLFGENITLTRACHMLATGRGHIGWYVYNGTTVPGTTVTVGKYGCLVHIEPRQEDRMSLQLVGSRLGQHIVGMNPQGVGGACGRGLLQQQFLYDNTVSVERWLESCDAHVIDFVRYAVGETKNF
jgi:translation elongation factor EF-Ts